MANLLQLALAAALCASLAIAAPRDLTVSWNTVTGAAPPVNVTYYYESLCKGCEGFIRTGMTDTWNKLKQYNMMFIELRPHGNARETKEGDHWKFECQHGPKECDGNVVECGVKTGVDVEKITKCATGKEGNELQHQMALKTGPHECVPWIIIDGKANWDALYYFRREVCKAYTGPKPAELCDFP